MPPLPTSSISGSFQWPGPAYLDKPACVKIGLARVITDYATYAYLCDVYVIESHRGRGLGSWLVRCALEHPAINSLKRIALITHDAKEFYARLGFQPPADPEQYMERIP